SFSASMKVICAPRLACDNQICPMVGNSNSPRTIFRRALIPSALAIELTPADALATSATSSGSAPIKLAKTPPASYYLSIHASHGEPCSCQTWRYSPNAASTRLESAPCEQLLRDIFFSNTGNWPRTAEIELSLSAKYDSFNRTTD